MFTWNQNSPLNKKLLKLQFAEYIVIYVLWIITFVLIWYVSKYYEEGSTFDPYQIMELEPGATLQ